MDYFYNLDYDSLKKYLLNADKSEKIRLLNDDKIKRKLIDSSLNRYNFVWLAQEDDNDIIPMLLSGNGMKMFSETTDISDKLNGILTSSCKYVDKLFEREEFNKIVYENFNMINSCFYNISGKAAVDFYNYLDKNKAFDKETNFIKALPDNSLEELLDKVNINEEVLNDFIRVGSKNGIEIILNKDLRITTLSDLSFYEIYRIADMGVKIPRMFMDDDKFIKRVASITNPKDYRFVVEKLKRENNIDKIEIERKKYYEKEFADYDKDLKMLKNYALLYKRFAYNMENNKYESLDEFLKGNYFYEYSKMYDDVFHEFCDLYMNKDTEKMKEFLQRESDLRMSDMIFDYHFEDIYFNFLVDIRSLLDFQNTRGRTLSDDDIKLYTDLVNLDKFSYEEKMNLHNKLKRDNQIEKFYDNYRMAKNKSFSLIEEKMISSENISDYLDKEKTKKYGVDVYVINDEDKFCFVKSLNVSKELVLEREDFRHYSDGASFSLDGMSKLDTFRNPREYYNILYGYVPMEQIVHIFPVDSFSNYNRAFNNNATNRAFVFCTPEELVSISDKYNEIVLAQNNEWKNDDVNNSLKMPMPIAIYCYDEIVENDIKSAKELGLSIALVNTKNKKKNQERDPRFLNVDGYTFSKGYENGFDYIRSIDGDSTYGRRR